MSVQFPQPDGPDCPTCHGTGDDCPFCPPHDEAIYLAKWHDGEFDDGLVGYDERDFYVGYERLMEAPHG